MMRIIIFLFLFISLNLYSQSIAELTLINDKTAKSVNYYDSSFYFLSMMESDTYSFKDLRPNRFKEISGDGYILKTRLLYSDFPVRGELIKYYTIDTLRIFKNFETYRGIKIGSSIQEVKNTYPDSIFYIPGKNYWDDKFWNCTNNSEVPVGLTAIIFWDYGIQKRTSDLNVDIEYGFTFYFDEKGNVKEIELGFLLTEL